MKTYQYIVYGKVQGVFYRYHIHKYALAAGFDGYVRNLSNGTVEACIALNNENKLDDFVDILKTGSPHSRVEQIKTRVIDIKIAAGFVIK
ncbi:MAG: acylphosphatase [Pseudomonadota bacterium]